MKAITKMTAGKIATGHYARVRHDTAIDRYELDRGTAFSSFAVPTILGELKRHFRDKGWSVRVPRDLQELAMRVDRKVTELSTDLGMTPDGECHV